MGHLGINGLMLQCQKIIYWYCILFQVGALKKIRNTNKNGRWWIKADACDLRPGLKESMSHEWAGDCDLGDGKLQALHNEYKLRRTYCQGIGLKARKGSVHEDLSQVISALDKDIVFLQDGEHDAHKCYTDKLKQGNASEDSLFALAWSYEGFKTLTVMNKELKSTVCSLQSRMGCSTVKGGTGNIPTDIALLRNSLVKYLQSLYSKRRETASHMMVFMIADEKRNSKPYAVPVQFLPYHGISDGKVRELTDNLRKVMVNMGMTVVG